MLLQKITKARLQCKILVNYSHADEVLANGYRSLKSQPAAVRA